MELVYYLRRKSNRLVEGLWSFSVDPDLRADLDAEKGRSSELAGTVEELRARVEALCNEK